MLPSSTPSAARPSERATAACTNSVCAARARLACDTCELLTNLQRADRSAGWRQLAHQCRSDQHGNSQLPTTAATAC